MSNPRKMRFAKYDTIGDPSAESDAEFLSVCFVDNGSLGRLRSCDDHRGIVVGRTGAGKTALLRRLAETEERVVVLDPHDIALKHLADSTIIRFFESLGVNMDLFYQALWRHVFVVELIKMRFGLDSEDAKLKAVDQIRFKFLRKTQKLRALEYLNEFGSRFWETTEERIKEATSKVESELKSVGGINIGVLARAGLEGSVKLTDEQKREFIEHGKDVVNKLQLSQLSLLMDGLDEELFTDPEKRYYIVIDRLDENWADDTIRYKLIRALIETMRHLNTKVRFAKAIVALRTDLLDRVLRATTDSGFQDEKYRGLCLHVTWKRQELTGLLDARISELVRKRYAHKEPVTHVDLLPNRIGQAKEAGIDYMLDRTLMRPRDLITFFNLCMANSEGEATISAAKLLQTEGQYSQERLHSVGDEWFVHYPSLDLICRLLEKRRSSFKLGDVSEADLDSLCLQVLDADRTASGEDSRILSQYLNKQLNAESLRVALVQILFRAGVVGLKTSSYTGAQWSVGTLDKVPSLTVDDDTTVEVHKMFWRALGIKP
jgi:hypothetical protein